MGGVNVTNIKGLPSFYNDSGLLLNNILERLVDAVPSKHYFLFNFSYDNSSNYPIIDLTVEVGSSPVKMWSAVLSTDIDYNFYFNKTGRFTNLSFEYLSFGDAFLTLNGVRPFDFDLVFSEFLHELYDGARTIIINTYGYHKTGVEFLEDIDASLLLVCSVFREFSNFIKGEGVYLCVDVFYGKYVEVCAVTPEKMLFKSFNFKNLGNSMSIIEKMLKRAGLF